MAAGSAVEPIERSEWRRISRWSLALVSITLLPYGLGAALSTPDQRFGGLLIGLEDQYSYLAKMVQGAHGAWLFQLPYTATPHPPIFLYAFYLLLGKVSALLGLPHVVVYHAARAVLGFITLLVIYRFIAEFAPDRKVRLLAWGLTAVMGGPGWVALLAGQPTLLDSLPLEFIVPEGFTFLMLYTLPHLLLARSLLLLGALGVWRAGQSGSIGLALIAGGAWLLMSIIQPIYSAVALTLAALMVLARSIELRRLAWRSVWAGALAGACAVPMVLYVMSVFAVDPTYGPWSQTAITSPGPELYAITFGLPLLLAVGGVRVVLRRRRAAEWFLLLWLAAGPLLVYAPTNAQRRLIESWQIPLSVLAAIGLWQLIGGRPRARRWIIGLVMILLSMTYGIMIGYHITALASRWPPLFQDAGLVKAAEWLDAHATYADGVLAAYDTSTMLPALAGVRVMTGHPSETIDSPVRRAEVQRFFAAETADGWRRDLLAQLRLNYVFYGPRERQLGSFDPATASYLEAVLSADETTLYRVAAEP